MARSRETITGIAISQRAICCAQSYADNNIITNISIQPISASGSDFWAGVSQAVKELVNNPEVKLSGEQVISALPAEFAVVKKLWTDRDDEHVEESLEWEFSQQIIGATEEYVFDFQKLTTQSAPGLVPYLMVGYRQQSVQKLQKILSSHKLTPIVIDLDIFALINIFELNYKDRLAEPALILYTEEDRSKLALTCRGEFIDIEVIEHQPDTIQDADIFIKDIQNGIATIEAADSHQNFRSSGCPIFLSGSIFSDDVFTRNVADRLPQSEVLYPFREISCTAGMKEEELRHYSPQLAVAAGLALRENGSRP